MASITGNIAYSVPLLCPHLPRHAVHGPQKAAAPVFAEQVGQGDGAVHRCDAPVRLVARGKGVQGPPLVGIERNRRAVAEMPAHRQLVLAEGQQQNGAHGHARTGHGGTLETLQGLLVQRELQAIHRNFQSGRRAAAIIGLRHVRLLAWLDFQQGIPPQQRSVTDFPEI